jgi:intracellular multiplication protein IcmE
MANRIANLLGNTKTRTLVLLIIGILIFGVVVAVTQTESTHGKDTPQRTSKTTEVPTQIKTTPGGDVSRKYQELQEKANARGAQEAEKKGTTFIPTLTGNAQGYNDKDFEKQLSSAYDDQGGKCSKEKVAELRKQGMDTTAIIKQLKSYGCSAAAIAALFTPAEIAAAFLAEQECAVASCTPADAKKLKDSGADANKIAATFKANGCKLSETVAALKANGATPSEMAAALKASGASFADIAQALKDNGVSAADIAVALKSAGASASEIASALTKAGFSKLDVLAALNKAGFAPGDISKAMASLEPSGADNAALLAQQRVDANRAAQEEAQNLAAFSQQRQAKIQELMAAMETQKAAAMTTWNEIPQQVLIEGDWAPAKTAKKADTGSGSGSGSSGSGSSSKFGSKDPNDKDAGKIIYKAGSILFAVLETAVNSDEKGPVLATIVSGDLKGSRLTGSMTTQSESDTISLSFTAINMPSENKSMGISAVAIDPDTARTALASDVDHHYLMRWGSLFASSFVQGYATAVGNSGQTQTQNQNAAGSTTTTTTPPLDAKQQLFSGLAAVGTKWSEVVARNFDKPSTITIDQGTGIGILITSDFTYGAEAKFWTAPNPNEPSPAVKTAGATGANGAPGAAGAPAAISTDQTAALMSAILKQQTAQAAPTTTLGGTK